MAKPTIESLGALVRTQRGERTIREAAAEIGIGTATLLRVEAGRIPDISTFQRLCTWLGRDANYFLGTVAPQISGGNQIQAAVHYKTDRIAKRKTIAAIAEMILLASNSSIIEPH